MLSNVLTNENLYVKLTFSCRAKASVAAIDSEDLFGDDVCIILV